MGRPKGSRNKPNDIVDAATVSIDENEKKDDSHEEKRETTEKAVLTKQKPDPLGPGQKYFEAPSGEILIGEEGASHMWWRAGNDGKGMWINPKR